MTATTCPIPGFIEATLGWLLQDRVAFVQTPQYYANARANPIAAASVAQQALFFGPISRGKDGLGSMICCGTNMILRRDALEEVGGFPEEGVTEDFESRSPCTSAAGDLPMSPTCWLAGSAPRTWRPTSASSTAGRAAASAPCRASSAPGCRGGCGSQFLLSSMYFLSGWTVLVYMSLPVIRMLTGAQPVAGATADQFLLHFAPYFGASLVTVVVAGAGAYTFAAFALAAASFWIHIHASLRAAAPARRCSW